MSALRKSPEEKIERRTVQCRGYTLYDADPKCRHSIRAKSMSEGGGVECRKCKGWFCY